MNKSPIIPNMIHFEITQSPDDNVRAPFKFFLNQVYLGRTSGNLHLDDNELLPNHMMIEVVENDLIVHPQKGVESYLINGKRATSIRKIKENDSITFGQTTLRILGFDLTPDLSKKKILNDKLSALVQNHSKRIAVIESLSRKSDL